MLVLICLKSKKKWQVKQETMGKKIEILIPLKYQSNFRGTLGISLGNCETNLDLNLSKNYVIVATAVADESAIF